MPRYIYEITEVVRHSGYIEADSKDAAEAALRLAIQIEHEPEGTHGITQYDVDSDGLRVNYIDEDEA